MDDFKKRRNFGQIIKRDPNAVHGRVRDHAIHGRASRKTFDQRIPFGLREITGDWNT